MAESVVKLRVDSNEYDAKIRRAADGVRAFGEQCQKAGQSVDKADKETLEYVQAIGRMETVSKNAKGKIGEMTSAFTELSVQYRHLTDQEKQSPFGKALAQSLDQLRQRINDSKSELNDVNRSLQDTSSQGEQTGGIMEQLASKFTVNVDAIKLFNIGLQAGSVALGVAKDAFFASEATVDEWGRIVDSSRSLYEGFLTSINTGDISGFLTRINQIVSAARAAYDELDRLGTMRTIQAPQISAQQTENDRIRLMIQTGRYIAPTDGRKPTPGMTNGQVLTPAQIKRLEQQLTNGMNNVVKLVGNEVQQTSKAIEAVYRRQGAELGMSVKEFKKGTSSMAEFDKRMAGYDAYKKWDAEAKTRFAQQGGRGFVDFDKSNPYAKYRRWGTFRVDGDRYNELVQLIQQRDQQAAQSYNMQGQAYRTMNRAEGITLRNIMGGGGGGGRTGGGGGGGGNTPPPPPAGSIAEQEAKVQALTKAWREATDEVGRAGYAGMLEEAKKVLDQMQGKTQEVIPEGSFKDLKNQLGDLQKQRELLTDPIEVAIIDTDIERVKDRIDELNGKLKEVANTEPISLEDKIRTSISDDKINADMQALTNLLRVKIENGLDDLDINTEGIQQAIFGEGIDIPDEYWEDLAEKINEKLKELGIDPIKIDVKTGNITQTAKEVKNGWQSAAQAVQAVGGALQAIEDPSIKIVGIIGQAIANIALGFAQATAKDSRLGVFGWIAAIAGGLATMISTIAAIHSATGYSEGGMIKGTSYSGDNIMANGGTIGLNAGEIVLNRAQQGNLASQLEGGGGLSNLHLEAKISAESLRILLNSNSRRRGRGEYVTSKSKG